MSGAFLVAQSLSRWNVDSGVGQENRRVRSVRAAALSTCEHQYEVTTSPWRASKRESVSWYASVASPGTADSCVSRHQAKWA